MRRTIVAEQELILYAEDGHRLETFTLTDKVQRSVRRIEQPLCIEGFQVDDLKAVRAAHT